MILCVASLWIRPGGQAGFEAAYEKAQRLLVQQQGYLSHELQQSVEREHYYVLLIEWRALEDYTLGLQNSEVFLRWGELLRSHLSEPPHVEHFRTVRSLR